MAVFECVLCGLSSLLCIRVCFTIDHHFDPIIDAPRTSPSFEGYGSISPPKPYFPAAPELQVCPQVPYAASVSVLPPQPAVPRAPDQSEKAAGVKPDPVHLGQQGQVSM